jgi:hypothetical protein
MPLTKPLTIGKLARQTGAKVLTIRYLAVWPPEETT